MCSSPWGRRSSSSTALCDAACRTGRSFRLQAGISSASRAQVDRGPAAERVPPRIDPWLHTGAEVRRLERHSGRRTARWCCCGKTRWIRSGQTGRPKRSAPSRSSRILFRCSCRGEIARIARELGERIGPVSSPIPRGRVDLQHPRQRRPAHAPSSGARDHRGERTCRAFPRQAQDRDRGGTYLAGLCTQVEPLELSPRLQALAASGARILVDPDLTPFALSELIRDHGGSVVEGNDPARSRARSRTPSTQRLGRRARADGSRRRRVPLLVRPPATGHGDRDRCDPALEEARRASASGCRTR